ncbi:MAG: hypothetical protein WA970_11925, partial [Gammaproteobacteria bacterium]
VAFLEAPFNIGSDHMRHTRGSGRGRPFAEPLSSAGKPGNRPILRIAYTAPPMTATRKQHPLKHLGSYHLRTAPGVNATTPCGEGPSVG